MKTEPTISYTAETPDDVLRRYWGYESFRPLQAPIIDSVLRGYDTIALLPTGGGKSITFQVPAVILPGLTLVVTPLVALMLDQVDDLRARGIRAAAVHSGLGRRDALAVLDNVIYSDYKLLYVSPERLQNRTFRQRLMSMEVSLIVVDECHCISQWGYDFRPEYLQIADIRRHVPEIPLLALTATATPEVVEDIVRNLGFREGYKSYRRSFYRTNLTYVVRKTMDKPREMYHILSRVEGSALVYVRTRKQAKDYADLLTAFGMSADYFHAGLTSETKALKQKQWQDNQTRIMVCTTAFGMGINKPDVRLVLHPMAPSSLESYYQEAGRAGRDNRQSYAVLLYAPEDDDEYLMSLIKKQYPTIGVIREVYEDLGNFFQLGVESGEGAFYELDLYKFSAHFGYPVHVIRAVLSILTLSGYIQYLEEHTLESRMMFTVTRNELYTLFDSEEEIYDDLVEVILREYPGMFTEMVTIDERRIAQRMGIPREQLYQLLTNLRRWYVIKYIPGKRSNFVVYTNQRVPVHRLVIPRAVYQDRRQRDAERVGRMLGYLNQSDDCRTKVIMEYFGENDPLPCGYCDYCLSHPTERLTYRKIDELVSVLKQYTVLYLSALREMMPALSPKDIKKALFFIAREGYPIDYDEGKGLIRWID